MVADNQAAGRVYCNVTEGLQYIVWTQNDGRLLAVVAGPLHENVWNWWVAVHHNIGLGGSPLIMNSPPVSTALPSDIISPTPTPGVRHHGRLRHNPARRSFSGHSKSA